MKKREDLEINVDNLKLNHKVSFDFKSIIYVIDEIIFVLRLFTRYYLVFSKDIANITMIRNKITDIKSNFPRL